MKPFEALLWILLWWLLFLSFVACWTELCVYSWGKLWTKAIWPPPPCASRSLLFWPLVSDDSQCTLEQNKTHFTYLSIKGAPFFTKWVCEEDWVMYPLTLKVLFVLYLLFSIQYWSFLLRQTVSPTVRSILKEISNNLWQHKTIAFYLYKYPSWPQHEKGAFS